MCPRPTALPPPTTKDRAERTAPSRSRRRRCRARQTGRPRRTAHAHGRRARRRAEPAGTPRPSRPVPPRTPRPSRICSRCWVRENNLADAGRRHPAHPPARQRHRPARPRPLLVRHRLAPLRPARPGRRPARTRPAADAVTVAALLGRREPGQSDTEPTWSAGSPTPYGAPPTSSPTAAPAPPPAARGGPLPHRRAVAPARPPAAPDAQEPRRTLRGRNPALLTRVARLLPAALDGRRPLRPGHRLGLDRTAAAPCRPSSSPPASAGDLPTPRPTPCPCRCTPGRPANCKHRPAVAALLDAGLLHDLGPHGDPWHPTSSVRTVHRPGAPAMLKLSLGRTHHQLPS